MEPTVSRAPTPLPSLWPVPAATGVQMLSPCSFAPCAQPTRLWPLPCAFPIREAPAQLPSLLGTHRLYAAAGYVVLCVNFHGSTGCTMRTIAFLIGSRVPSLADLQSTVSPSFQMGCSTARPSQRTGAVRRTMISSPRRSRPARCLTSTAPGCAAASPASPVGFGSSG